MNIFNKKLIFDKLFKDTLKFFLIVTFSFGIIVWIIQAVNFLDFVTEDGHGLDVYFKYTLLNFPKILAELVPLMFFISLFYTLIRYEDNNELKIFWLIGIEKNYFVNQILKYSLLITITLSVLHIFIIPHSQNKARSFLKSSKIDFFPSLIQDKKFIDTVSNLTIFIEAKNKNVLENVFLEEKKEGKKKIIYAEKGLLIINEKVKLLKLNNGKIININNENYNEFNFETTNFKLDNYITKSTIDFKIQEKGTQSLLSCFWNFYIKDRVEEYYDITNCNKEALNSIASELYKRIIKPSFIVIVSLIVSFLIYFPKEHYFHRKNKFIIFISGFTAIIISEFFGSIISSNYYSLVLINFFPIFCIMIILLINKKLNLFNNV